MRIIIAAGGTGGHIFPGLAVAEAVRKRDPAVDLLFVGSKKGIEAGLVVKEGYKFKEISAKGLKGGTVVSKVKSLVSLFVAMAQSAWIAISFRPDLVLGLGGYASGPVALVGKLFGARLIVHEQNSTPGFTNKILAWFADKVAVSFEKTLERFKPGKALLTGNPVREKIALSGDTRPEGFGLGLMKVLAFGGSQGSLSINKAMTEAIDFMVDLKGEVSFIHQTGRGQDGAVAMEYEKRGFDARVEPFIEDMAEAYSEADFVVCRAGATTVAELMAAGKPAILIPYPHAASNHQLENAQVLLEAGAASIIEERELSGQRLASEIKRLKAEPGKLRAMGEKAKSLAIRGAAENLADLCFKFAQRRRS